MSNIEDTQSAEEKTAHTNMVPESLTVQPKRKAGRPPNPKHEFDQLPKESAKAYAAFRCYLNGGTERTHRMVLSLYPRNARLISYWASKYRWQDRIRAYDAHMAAVELAAAEKKTAGAAVSWAKRQKAVREKEYNLHELCIQAARKGLAAYLDPKRRVRSTLSDIARILEVASKLGRLASGMATDHVELTGEDGGPIQVELQAALKKIYGDEVVDVAVVPENAPALQDKPESTGAPEVGQ